MPATATSNDPEKHKAEVFQFVEDLTAKTGVPLDPEEVWNEVQNSTVRDEP